jgi:hypothetical protein
VAAVVAVIQAAAVAAHIIVAAAAAMPRQPPVRVDFQAAVLIRLHSVHLTASVRALHPAIISQTGVIMPAGLVL